MRGPLIAGAIVMTVATGLVAGQPKKLPRIAIGAIGEVGGTSQNQAIATGIEQDIARLGLGEVIDGKAIERNLKQNNKPQLLACESDRSCLAETGRAVGAAWVIGAELGGLGELRVLHLILVRSKDGEVIRRTTSTLDGDKVEAGKLTQLLAPKRYRGKLLVKANVADAEVVVDAAVLGKAPPEGATFPLDVGTRALRITHPNYRDHVRFIEIEFDKTTTIDVEMIELDVSRQNLERQGAFGPSGAGVPSDGTSRPWYARWYVVAGVGAAVLVGSVAIWSARGGLGADREVDLPQ